MFWGCDNPSEGTLQGPKEEVGSIKEEEHAALIDELEKSRARARAMARAQRGAEVEDGAAALPGSHELERAPMADIFKGLSHFVLCTPASGGPELKLYDAMQNPDKLLAKHSYFVAEGALVVQQLLQLRYRFVSLLSTEPTLRKVLPDLCGVDAALRETAGGMRLHTGSSCEGTNAHPEPSASTVDQDGAAAEDAEAACCTVYVGTRADISRITGETSASARASCCPPCVHALTKP